MGGEVTEVGGAAGVGGAGVVGIDGGASTPEPAPSGRVGAMASVLATGLARISSPTLTLEKA